MIRDTTHYVWDHCDEGNSCLLQPPVGVPRRWELHEGLPRANDFPGDVVFHMMPVDPRAMGLTDNLMNIGSLVVVSSRLKQFLQQRPLRNVEYLPVTILNHKGRVAANDYCIVHPVPVQDCLDIPACGAIYSRIIPADIASVERIVLEEGQLDPGVELFRLARFGPPVIVSASLAEAIIAEDFTGTFFSPLDPYGV